MGGSNHDGYHLQPPFFPSWLDGMRYIDGGSSSLQQLSEALSLLKHCYQKEMTWHCFLWGAVAVAPPWQGGKRGLWVSVSKIHLCPFVPKRATLGMVHASVGPHCPVAQGTVPFSCLKGISMKNVGQIPRTESWTTTKKLNFNAMEHIPPQSHIKIIKIEF